MALTPYPSLATLPEVIANGGKLPGRSIDVFAARTIYASTIPGVVLDCDIHAGTRIGGGTPTNNATAINAVLARASATNPVHLVIDGGAALGSPLVIPATGYVTVTGMGWNTGFFWLSGSNCNCINTSQYGTTDFSRYNAVHPTTAQSITGKCVRLADFYMNCNRGTFPNGLVSNYAGDGTMPASTGLPSGPAPFAGGYDNWNWLSGIALQGIDDVTVERVWVYDAPTYHVDLYHCTKVRVHQCRIEAPGRTRNTDGVHVNGGCSDVWVTDSWLGTGDDAVALNISEGDGTAGKRFTVSGCHFSDCNTGVRVHGKSTAVPMVNIARCTGDVRYLALVAGLEAFTDTAGHLNNSIVFSDSQITITQASGAFAWIVGSFNSVDLRGIKVVEPAVTVPVIVWDGSGGTHGIDRLSVDVEVIRNAAGNQPVPILAMSSGTLSGLDVVQYKVTDLAGQSYSAVSSLLGLSGGASVGRVWVESLDPSHVTALTNDFTKIGSIGGPGLVASGFAIPDANAATNAQYLGSDHSGKLCFKDSGGTVHTLY